MEPIKMTQEEKLEKAKELYKTANADQRYVLECLFSELAKSEDERIRKALKEYFINSFQNNGVAAICGVHIKDILAWLEKQGEQILANSSKKAIEDIEQQTNKDFVCWRRAFECVAETPDGKSTHEDIWTLDTERGFLYYIPAGSTTARGLLLKELLDKLPKENGL